MSWRCWGSMLQLFKLVVPLHTFAPFLINFLRAKTHLWTSATKRDTGFSAFSATGGPSGIVGSCRSCGPCGWPPWLAQSFWSASSLKVLVHVVYHSRDYPNVVVGAEFTAAVAQSTIARVDWWFGLTSALLTTTREKKFHHSILVDLINIFYNGWGII